MSRKNQLKIIILLLLVASLACNLSPTSIIEKAAEGFVEDAEATLMAQTGLSLEDIRGTAEAVIDEVGLEGIQATAEAMTGDLSIENIQATAEALVGGEIAVGEAVETDFPIPPGALSTVMVGETLNITMLMTTEAAVEFYRTEFTALGYTERSYQELNEDNTVYMVFDGHESGMAIILLIVDLDPVGINISISLRDM
jgi:hypothetical protein